MGGKKAVVRVKENATVADLLEVLNSTYPAFQRLSSLAVALNEEYAEIDDVLHATDTIVLVPPVSGG